MIPPFDDAGYLPPGIHPAALAEIDERFGGASELRRVQMESVRWMVELARRAGMQRIVLNGSFVTDIIEPNDVDCALLMAPDFPKDRAAESELLEGLSFIDPALVDAPDLTISRTDRMRHSRGATERLISPLVGNPRMRLPQLPP